MDPTAPIPTAAAHAWTPEEQDMLIAAVYALAAKLAAPAQEEENEHAD